MNRIEGNKVILIFLAVILNKGAPFSKARKHFPQSRRKGRLTSKFVSCSGPTFLTVSFSDKVPCQNEFFSGESTLFPATRSPSVPAELELTSYNPAAWRLCCVTSPAAFQQHLLLLPGYKHASISKKQHGYRKKTKTKKGSGK